MSTLTAMRQTCSNTSETVAAASSLRGEDHCPLSISLRGVGADYSGVSALEGVDLDLPSQKFIALVGPNGAGKSTLLKLLTGVKRSNRGSIEICGTTLAQARRENLVGYIPQEADIDWDFPLSVYDVVLGGRYGHARHEAGLRRFLPPRFLGSSHHQAVRQALEAVGMEEFARRPIGALSGGQKKRVFLARTLAQHPRVLLLDEPLAGVDRASEELILKVLRRACGEGKTVIMVTHDLPTAREQAELVVLINHGVMGVGAPREMLSSESLERCYHRQGVKR
ncbi:manganese/iron transport system ATP-binding protein [Alkalispirochaeta americana]|uniref:Manganese/iron transport system ATP-binding protein n=1 Tax=Alkalispirochaeta americana TaxID=159291 RepID=A0A1N6QI61_9SPIO|nr:metal ABC transporter ATP-binding protein [Alkalispirochaeta americana]SIQ16284.1 manganese/iron transport system ATP-binding protein [Alkalispirochaeta americana]